jgi:hypothetical protein
VEFILWTANGIWTLHTHKMIYNKQMIVQDACLRLNIATSRICV